MRENIPTSIIIFFNFGLFSDQRAEGSLQKTKVLQGEWESPSELTEMFLLINGLGLGPKEKYQFLLSSHE